MFSKACEYGLRAVIYTAMNSEKGGMVSLNDIALAINSPNSFTAKILQKLVREKIIKSSRGAYGGFQVPEDEAKSLTISRIVKAIDGDQVYEGCGLGLENCSEEKPCPVHDKFKKIRTDLKAMLETTTVFELADPLKAGESSLK